ncbi:hypothetical protein [Bradyrhizobium sp.]|nr:hypothetical protein [Bradyrhizobium sp.]
MTRHVDTKHIADVDAGVGSKLLFQVRTIGGVCRGRKRKEQ